MSVGRRTAAIVVAALCIAVLTLAASNGLLGAAGTFSTSLPLIVKGYVPSSSLAVYNIVDNGSTFPNSQIPKYEKFEITFQITNTTATNFQMPYDENPPPGIPAKIGITVNAQFSQDSFQTIYTQPAFYYQDFDYQVKSDREWFYPTSSFSWKARFAPNREGPWQYRLVAQDASGGITSPTYTFNVTSSSNHGFVRVSKKDPRYFEFEDGSYFPGLGYNMNFDRVSWNNPVLDNQSNFQIMSQNGIQLVRMWLSQWGIFSGTNNPWRSLAQGSNYDGLSPDRAYPGSDFSMRLQWQWNPTMFLGWMKEGPAVKRNTNYHVWIRYLIPTDLTGPRVAGQPYGLIAKTAGTWQDHPENAGSGSVATAYKSASPKDGSGQAQWSTLEGSFSSGSSDFLPFFYLTLENVTDLSASGGGVFAYIDRIDVKEDLGNGTYGPNIVDKPSMAQHQYFGQEYSYRFDKTLELARQNNVYFKLVTLEKSDYIQDHVDYNGQTIPDGQPGCTPPNGTVECPGNNWFYGNWDTMTKNRWLQQAWWRYLQARWGYSPNIHSWELLNEGDPFSGLHYSQAQALGHYMHQFAPNSHLVTTSLWTSVPRSDFWTNASYPDIDYADVHQYKGEGQSESIRIDNANVSLYAANDFYDTAAADQKLSTLLGAKQQYGMGKPIVRGETGFFTGNNTDNFNAYFNVDTQGKWLHKFVWAQINPGGMMDLYWYDREHIYPSGNDHRAQFGYYYNFIKGVPLNNGSYQDVTASTNNVNLRAWGQKDSVNGKAHLWIDNVTDNWYNAVNNPSAIVPQTGTVSFAGLPQGNYTVTWYDTYSGGILRTEPRTIDSSGGVSLNVTNLPTDVAVKVER